MFNESVACTIALEGVVTLHDMTAQTSDCEYLSAPFDCVCQGCVLMSRVYHGNRLTLL